MDIPQWQLSSVVSEKQLFWKSWRLVASFFLIFKTIVHKKQDSQQKRVQSYQKHVRVFTLNNNSTRTTSSYFVLMFSFLTLTIKTTDKNVFKVTKKRVKQGFNLFRVNNKNIRMASSDVVLGFSLPTLTVKKKKVVLSYQKNAKQCCDLVRSQQQEHQNDVKWCRFGAVIL